MYLHDVPWRDDQLVHNVERDAEQRGGSKDPSHHDGPRRILVLSLQHVLVTEERKNEDDLKEQKIVNSFVTKASKNINKQTP
jgi:hypothetical protein